jgi:hypothetical protein
MSLFLFAMESLSINVKVYGPVYNTVCGSIIVTVGAKRTLLAAAKCRTQGPILVLPSAQTVP